MGAGASAEVSEEKAAAVAKTKGLLGDRAMCKEVWSKLDYNGNGVVSVAETDKFIVENADNWDGFFKPVINEETGKSKQPVLIRAWKRATCREYSTHEDGFVHKHEFRIFVRLILQYTFLFDIFEEVNGDDRRINKEEFIAAGPKIGAEEGEDLGAIFDKVDTNGGGQILFDEFCAYAFHVMD